MGVWGGRYGKIRGDGVFIVLLFSVFCFLFSGGDTRSAMVLSLVSFFACFAGCVFFLFSAGFAGLR